MHNETWITVYYPDLKDACMAGEKPDPYIVKNDPNHPNPVTFFSLHIRVMYWAMATMSSMGYGRSPTA